MQRRYSASPYQTFLTGSGAQTFSNFDRNDNDRILTVEHALQNSVNLVFVRVMREITDHLTYRTPSVAAALLDDPRHPERSATISRVLPTARVASSCTRFYRKYAGQTRDAAFELALEGSAWRPGRSRRSCVRCAPTHRRACWPDISRSIRVLAGADRDKDVSDLYDKYSADRFSLNDRGYLARVHPLELWVLAYLETHPNATLSRSGRGERRRATERVWRGCSRAVDAAVRIVASRSCSRSMRSSKCTTAGSGSVIRSRR